MNASRHARRGQRSEHRHGWNPRLALLRDKRSPLVRTIVTMTKRGATLGEIGQMIGGVTKQRAYQLKRMIAAIHGRVPVRERTVLTLDAVVGMCRASPRFVCNIARRCGLVGDHRSGRHYRFTPAQARRLRRVVAKERSGVCAVCRRPFLKTTWWFVVCSRECRERRRAEQRRACFCKPPSAETLHSPQYRRLWKILRAHTLPRNEQWLLAGPARKLTGLSRAKLQWLTARHVLTTRPSRKQMCRGRPFREYARSELLIARRVLVN